MKKTENVPHSPLNNQQGEGPFEKLVLKGGIIIDGTGGPPEGPVDIIIENNRIKDMAIGGSIAYDKNTKIIDVSGKYIMPGFVDTHAHIGGINQGVPAEYVHKLWLAHGVTTIREPGSFNGADWTLYEKEKSAKNEIVAPRIYAYTFEKEFDSSEILVPEKAKSFVEWAKNKGFDGFKIINRWNPETIKNVIAEAEKQELGTMAHLSQTTVSRMDTLKAAQMGLGSMEHWYGLPESLFTSQVIQDFPFGYNYANEYDRFSQSGKIWKQASAPYSDHWNRVMNELIELDFTITPTFTIYEATRDIGRAKNLEYHENYTLPSLWDYYTPNPENHGSFFFDWTTQNEIDWKNNYQLWMTFINEFKNRGGRVTTGSDSGFIYNTYGFEYIRELELLQESGFHPLEVIRSATMLGAELLSKENNQPMEFGVIEANKLADLVIVDENPIHNFKTLYGNGTMQLNTQTNTLEQVGGVTYTIKDGIIYDAKELLKDVEEMVTNAKKS